MNLDDWIKEQDITYPQFAEIINVPLSTLFRIRKGEITKSLEIVREIEKYTMGKVMLKDICDSTKKKKNEKKRQKNSQT